MLGQLGISVGFVGGLLTGAVVAALVVLSWRHLKPALARLRYLLAAGLVSGFAIAAGVMYLATAAHSGGAGAGPAAASTPIGTVPGSAAAAPPEARSMELEVSALEARLARTSGTESDWKLLAEAYDFLGRPADARRARAHVGSTGVTPVSQMSAATLVAAAGAAGTVPATPGSPPAAPTARAAQPDAASIGELERLVSGNPEDAAAWLALADLHRAQRDYAGARAAYAKVIALHAMSAQSWADYADVLGSLAGGSLHGEAAAAIESGLRLDPSNPKALWLKASAEHQGHHDAEALIWWRRLRAALPSDSADAQIIDANIAEAEALAKGGSHPAADASAVSTPVAAAVSGTVSLDARFSNRVPPGATLFIYAKAADSPGPPLAVLRLTPSGWPVSFQLDDSMAMLPARRLSQFDKVIVEARISRMGQATPSSGDLYVTSPVVRPAAAQSLALVINREIG